jgi:hypothetical protein
MQGQDRMADLAAPTEQQRITAAVQVIAESRALIEQAKGMLMLLYGIDGDKAFDLLRWQSQEHNIKLRLIAEQVMKDMIELSRSKSLSQRLSTDSLLLTAHQRVVNVAARQLDGQSKTGVPLKEL